MSLTAYEVPTRTTFGNINRQILTVGELIGLLGECDENDHVVVGAQCVGHGWLNVSAVEFPNEDTGVLAVSLIAASTFDTRQF